MIIKSTKYKELRIVGVVKFRDGVAEVSDPKKIEKLRNYGHWGIVVPTEPASGEPDAVDEAPKGSAENQPPADNEHVADGAELFEPKGNASVEEWRAYAVQKGQSAEDVADLKREDIKALLLSD